MFLYLQGAAGFLLAGLTAASAADLQAQHLLPAHAALRAPAQQLHGPPEPAPDMAAGLGDHLVCLAPCQLPGCVQPARQLDELQGARQPVLAKGPIKPLLYERLQLWAHRRLQCVHGRGCQVAAREVLALQRPMPSASWSIAVLGASHPHQTQAAQVLAERRT